MLYYPAISPLRLYLVRSIIYPPFHKVTFRYIGILARILEMLSPTLLRSEVRKRIEPSTSQSIAQAQDHGEQRAYGMRLSISIPGVGCWGSG